MRTLVLLRHAKAEREGDLGDAMRPLTGRGRRQVGATGPQLADVAPFDLALVSSALRTTETYKLLGHHVAVGAHEIRDELYQTDPRGLLALLHQVDPGATSVIVVGHEPTMSGTAALLHDTRDDLADQISLGIPTGSACVLDVPREWADLDRSTAHLRTLVTPGI